MIAGVDFSSLSGTIFEVVTIALLGLLLVVLAWAKQSLEDWRKALAERLFHRLDRLDFDSERRVNSLLLELRVTTRADRAYLVQFHNGQVFTNQQPVWRMSCTHETCKTGISYEAKNLQSLMCSLLLELLECFWTGRLYDGMEKLPCTNCDHCLAGTFMVTAASLHEGAAKAITLERGVIYSFLTPIKLGQDVVGFVAVDYCHVPDTLQKIKADVQSKLCSTASTIAYLMRDFRKK